MAKNEPKKKTKAAKVDPAAAAPKKESSGVKALEIPNKTISLLYVILNVPLHGPQLRARNVFGNMIKDRILVLEDERIRIIEQYVNRDPNTKEPLRKNVGTPEEEYDITPEGLAKYRKELNELMSENWIIDLVPSVKPVVIHMRPLVLESKMNLETTDGYLYEELCKAFEAI